jgi:putative transposase
LRKGRWSIPGARYFVTFCTKDRVRYLEDRAAMDAITSVWRELAVSKDVDLFASCVMPNHVHVLFALGERLSLGQVVVKFKALTRRRLPSVLWQENSFDRHLRPDESLEDYGLYLFLNPYRARLLAEHENWSGWFCGEPGHFSFLQHLSDQGTPPPEWLRDESFGAKPFASA